VSVGGLPGAREAFCDVAVSRARRRCVVAASLTGRAISLPRVHSSTRSISLVLPSLRAAGINCIPSPANGRHPHCQSPSVPLRLPARHPACLLVFSTQCRTRRFYVPALEQRTGNYERGLSMSPSNLLQILHPRHFTSRSDVIFTKFFTISDARKRTNIEIYRDVVTSQPSRAIQSRVFGYRAAIGFLSME